MLIFHQSNETTSPTEDIHETKNRKPKEDDHGGGVTVKKEVIQDGEEEEEEEEVNVDDQVGQEEHEKAETEEQKLKMEVDSEITSCKESWLSPSIDNIFRSDLRLINC